MTGVSVDYDRFQMTQFSFLTHSLNRRFPVQRILLLVVLLAASVLRMDAADPTTFDIVRDGRVTDHAGIVGRTTAQGDEQQDHAFVLNGLYKFVYAGAGFTSPNGRIRARLAIRNSMSRSCTSVSRTTN